MATLTFMTHTIFDHGASAQLGQVLAQHGIRRPLLCTDRGLVSLGMVDDLAGGLGNDAALTIFDGTPEILLKWRSRRQWQGIKTRTATA